MPRVNPLRPTGNETSLARRIAAERERRGWSFEGLAKRMGDAGFSIQASAIFKIEKGNPPRRITVDELVGFAKVFDLSVDEMLTAEEIRLTRDAQRAFVSWYETRAALGEAQLAFNEAKARLEDFLVSHPETADGVEQLVRMWGEAEKWPNMDEATEYFMLGFRRASAKERASHVKRWTRH